MIDGAGAPGPLVIPNWVGTEGVGHQGSGNADGLHKQVMVPDLDGISKKGNFDGLHKRSCDLFFGGQNYPKRKFDRLHN